MPLNPDSTKRYNFLELLFSKQVIGINKLNAIVKTFREKAEFSGYFTNHSGKVMCATDHRGHDTVRQYKWPSIIMKCKNQVYYSHLLSRKWSHQKILFVWRQRKCTNFIFCQCVQNSPCFQLQCPWICNSESN